MTCKESLALGAYVLGALEPAERSAMERHLATCPMCRDELLGLAPLPGLLRHTPFEELPEVGEHELREEPVETLTAPASDPLGDAGAAGTPDVPPPVGPVPARRDGPDGGGRQPRKRRRRLLTGAGLALAACAAAVSVYFALSSDEERERPGGRSSVVTLAASDPDTNVSASAALTPKVWGTSVELTLNNLPEEQRCTMVVHARDGRRETSGWWATGYHESTVVPGSTSISPQDITRIDIVSGTGKVLVRLPRP